MVCENYGLKAKICVEEGIQDERFQEARSNRRVICQESRSIQERVQIAKTLP